METARKSLYAAVKNKEFIVDVLRTKIPSLLPSPSNERPFKFLEIASGTGEHAATFLETLVVPLRYQPTEIDLDMHSSITAWTEPFADRVMPTLSLNVMDENAINILPAEFGARQVDIMVCINMVRTKTYGESEIVKFTILLLFSSDSHISICLHRWTYETCLPVSLNAFDVTVNPDIIFPCHSLKGVI